MFELLTPTEKNLQVLLGNDNVHKRYIPVKKKHLIFSILNQTLNYRRKLISNIVLIFILNAMFLVEDMSDDLMKK